MCSQEQMIVSDGIFTAHANTKMGAKEDAGHKALIGIGVLTE